jgi:hypothetical protein
MSSFGAPPDPAYTAFLDGLKRFAALPVGKSVERWHPKDAHWYSYDPKDWGEEDLSAPKTPPESGLTEGFSGFGQKWELHELQVPDLFARVQKAYATLSSQHATANLVWTPAGGGEWRNAFKRPTKGSDGTPPIAITLIAQVRQLEGTGDLTHAEAEARIKQIKAQYEQA